MSRYLKAVGRVRATDRQVSRLAVSKLKSWGVWDAATSPVSRSTGGISLSVDPVRQLEVRLEDCGNAFVTDVVMQTQRSGPLALAAGHVKGCNRVVQRYQNVHKVYSRESHVYQCDFFRLMYFPPDHFLSLFRKSKPAVNVRTVGQAFLNGSSGSDNEIFQRNSHQTGFLRTQNTQKCLGRLFENNPSNIPRNYAFLRRQLRVALRKCFIKEWCALKGDLAVQEAISSKGAGTEFTDDRKRSRLGIAKDGYYMYQVLIFPDKLTREEFESCVKESVRIVANLDWEEFLKAKTAKSTKKTWVQIANDRIRIDSLNRSLENNGMALAVKKSLV